MRSHLLLVALVACKRDDNGAFGRLPDAHVTILNDGAGPENQTPLEPAQAGTTMHNTHLWQRWIGALDAGRDDVLAKEYSGGNQPQAPTFGQGGALYRFTDDGLVVHAIDAPLDDETLPILMVPETVRVGMEWESDNGDGTVNHMVVDRHWDVMLPTGPASAWSITETVDAYNTKARWYAEGIGRIDTGSASSMDLDYTEAVVPNDDQVHDEPALNPVPLSGAVPIVLEGQYYEIWGLSGAVSDGTLFAYVDGEYPQTPYSPEWQREYCARLDSPPQWATGGAGCPTHVVETCSTTWDGYGQVTTCTDETSLIDNAAVILPGVDTQLDLSPVGGVADTVLTGWMVDGVAHRLTYEAAGTDMLFLEYPISPDLTELPAIVDQISTRGAFLSGADTLAGQIWVGPSRVDAGATLYFAVIAPDGRVFRVTLADGALSGFVPVGVLPGAPSILLNGDERLVDSITTDGRVFELRVDQTTGDVSINGLGAVRVEEPGGAYEFKGVLVDPTHPGDMYVAAIATNDHLTSDPTYASGLFLAHLDAQPVPLVSAASLAVGAAELDAGLAVCWAPSDEPLDTSGWTLRGEPVGVRGPVGPNGNCAFMDFDPAEVANPNWAGAERAIEATVPGVGRVRLGFPAGRHVGYSLDPLVAALPDGTIADVAGLVLDRDGFPVSRVPTHRSSGSYYTAWARDLGGYGFWTWGTSPTSPLDLRNIGGGGAVAPTCPDTGSFYRCFYGGAVSGGGALYVAPGGQLLPTQVLVLRPDGAVESAPEAQAGAVYPFAARIRLADGRICGLTGSPSRVDCVDTTGAIATTGPLTGGNVPLASRDPFWLLSDGSLMLPGAPTLRVDPATMIASTLDPRDLTSAVTSPDGHVYAIAQGYDGYQTYTFDLVEVTPAGASEIMPVSEYTTVVPIDGALLVSMPWRRIARP